MCEPALDKENRIVVTCFRWLPNTVIPEKIQAKQVTGVGGDMEFPKVLINVEIPGVY